jgi:hypothetical protein
MFRFIKAVPTVIVLMLLAECGVLKPAYGATAQVQVCDSITNAQPGTGVAYRGTVRNSDYGLTVQIPAGQIAWGAAPEAPFHGFAIFLSDQPKSCIIFEIHLRVDTKDKSPAESEKRIRLGNRGGWEEQTKGVIAGVEWSNVTVRFSMHHVHSGNEVDDGSIILVTPTQDIGKNTAIFREFMSHMRFGGNELIISANVES